MLIEFDETKRQATLEARQLDFADANQIWQAYTSHLLIQGAGNAVLV
ncbi:hypothetical protein [Wielerella bovis]|nr:hypothetical protein [Wielerella bovis]MCG7656059.1 hypothetical protein [Wielerella bovis]MCG7658285.1 hypothetical protein [Wielerella bovis]